jgi:hypothetical protein
MPEIPEVAIVPSLPSDPVVGDHNGETHFSDDTDKEVFSLDAFLSPPAYAQAMEEATILPQDEIKKEADIEEEERKY